MILSGNGPRCYSAGRLLREDLADMRDGWMAAEEWGRIQRSMPIACVDVVPVCASRAGEVERVGLIWRALPEGKQGWCMVGGRVWYQETLAAAIRRHLRETLGEGISFHLGADPQPVFCAQYFPQQGAVGQVDPRQHAIALTFVVVIEGTPAPRGEGLLFEWFAPGALPAAEQFGFGQERVVRAALAAFAGAGAAGKNQP